MASNFTLNVKIDKQGITRIARHIERLDVSARQDLPKLSYEMGMLVRQVILDKLDQPGGGRIWNRENSPSWWRNIYSEYSSAPGEPPHSQTGGLANSIYVFKTPSGNANLEVGFGMERPYVAFYMEYGGWTSWKGHEIPARPFVRPSLEEARDDLQQLARDHFRDWLWGQI